MATDAEAIAAGYAVPADTSLISAGPGFIRQNARQAAPGAWQNCTLAANHTYDTTVTTGPATLQIRETPLGFQLRGRRIKSTATIVKDGPLATVPLNYRPVMDITFLIPCQRAGTGNPAATLVVKLKASTGEIQYVDAPAATNTSLTGGSFLGDFITFNNIILSYT